MDLSSLPPIMVTQFASMVEGYIAGSRAKFAPQAIPLTEAQRATMAPFFPGEILDRALLCVLRGNRIPNPVFYAMAKMMGINNLPDFSAMAATTFNDVVVAHDECTDIILFHELVHVVQYAQLGLKEFSVRYINGFIQSGSHEQIATEKKVYELDSRFSQNGHEPFSVEEIVRQWTEAGKI